MQWLVAPLAQWRTMAKPLRDIPTHVITGSLGVGKTTTILSQLESKPKGERWAVLVNEFGQVGLDGALLEPASTTESGVTHREVVGGCICCAMGVPFKVLCLSIHIVSEGAPAPGLRRGQRCWGISRRWMVPSHCIIWYQSRLILSLWSRSATTVICGIIVKLGKFAQWWPGHAPLARVAAAG